MPPQGIDMSAIQEAMQRRAAGGAMAATDQMTAPTGSLPGGAPNTPGQNPMAPQTAPQPQRTVGQAGPVSQDAKVLMAAKNGGGAFDDDTKASAKALVTKLMKYL